MKSKTHLPQAVYSQSVSQLESVLAHLHILYMTARNIHWNLIDSSFLSLHKLFEETYDDLAEKIDETAEQIRSIGAFAPAYFPEYREKSTIDHVREALTNKSQAMPLFIQQMETVILHLMKLTQESDTDPVRQDFYIGMTADLEKSKWLIASHMDE